MIENDVVLLESDKISPMWHRLSLHLNKRLAIHRAQLEADVDNQRSTKLRGQIAEIKAILALAEDRPFVEE